MGHTIDRLLHPACVSKRNRCAAVCLLALAIGVAAWPQTPAHSPAHKMRARRFLAGRDSVALAAARQRQAAMQVEPRGTPLSAYWQPVGPGQIASLNYGNVTGRVTSIALDPADATGNTVFLGTTGGGVWRSINATAAADSVVFTPLTDTLSVFNPGSGADAAASLSIGAASVANGVLLAGTGDPNDALDSYYGSGILRVATASAADQTAWTLIQQSNDGVTGSHSWIGLGFAGFAWNRTDSGTSPATVVAAVSDAAEGFLVSATDPVYSTRGLYFSTDAGMTWRMATIMDGSQIVQSPQPDGLNRGGNAATAVAWNPVRQRFYAAVRYHGYYESLDGSLWTRLAAQPGTGLTTAACPPETNTTGSSGCPILRGALAVEPASGDMYAFTVDGSDLDQGIWRDVCNPAGGACLNPVAFGVQLDSTPLQEGFGSTRIEQGDYDLSLSAVASGTETLLFAGAVDLYRCSLTTASSGSGGCAFRDTTNAFNGCDAPAMVAPAQHAIAALPESAGPLVYLGNDGGVWRSIDGVAETGTPCSASDASHFQNLNTGLGSLAEVVSFAQDPAATGTLIVGVGANGTAATSAATNTTAWPQLAEGEGGYTAIDPVTPANWYISTGPGVNISYCANGAQCGAADFAGLPAVGEVQVDEDASVIDAPWILDPGFPANVGIGTCRVWRGPGSNGAAWSVGNAISAEFGGSRQSSCGAGNAFVRSLAAGGAVGSAASGANAGSEVLYAGLAGTLDGGGTLGGHLFATDAAHTASRTTAWTDLGLNPVTNDQNGGIFNPNGFDLSSVAVDPHDPAGATVYATVMGFSEPHVYRSADGGADWLNISSNLPNAPANAVVVDPNDAATVYVAMDTGVYAATAVSTCATGPCWSVLGTGLPNAPVVGLQAGAGLSDGAGNAGLLRAATYGRGIWQIPLLSAAPATIAAVGLSPVALSFPAEAVGSSGPAQTITVTNTGSASATLTSLSTTGDFAETGNCAAMTLAPGASCAAQVTFAATAIGQRLGALTVVFEKAGTVVGAGQVTALLTGTGEAAAAVDLSPPALNFGGVVAGTTSPAQSVTVANSGGSPATLGTPTMTGDFSIAANGCGGTLAAGTQCSVGIVFAPTGTGTLNGTLSVPASTGTQIASLTGVGESPATDPVSPGALNFGLQQQNTTSVAQQITLANSGDTALTGISASVSGAGFALTNGCAGTLAGHSACMLTVTFTPGSVGAQTGTVTVVDSLRTQTVLLSGTGYPPPRESVTPTSLSFGPGAVGVSSPVQQLTVTNSGGGGLALGAVTVTGDFSQTNSCAGATLGGGIHCAVNVVFTPAALGMRTGTVTIAGAAAGTGVTIPLTGVGATVAAIGIAPSSLVFGSVPVGSQSATMDLAVLNSGGLPGTIGAAAVTGNFQLQSNYCGTALAAGAQCLVGIVFLPTASGAQSGAFSIAGPDGLLTAALTGTGLAPATDTLSPSSLTFAPQETQTASPTQTVLLTNSGDAALTGIQASISPTSFALASSCGASLAGHAQCALNVGFDATVAGLVTGTLRVSDQSRAQPQIVPLTGTGLAPARIVLTPSLATFGNVVIGLSSAALNITVSNTGGVAAALGSPTVVGDFAITANTCGTSLAPGVGCTIAIVFMPTLAAQRNGRLSIPESSASQSATVSAGLTGTGLAPATDSLSPLSLSFGPQAYGTTSATQNITLTNTGDAALTPIAAAIVSGSYTVVNNCGGSLAGHASCTLAVAFAPAIAGPMPGQLTVSDPIRTQSVALSGTGTGPPLAAAAPAMLSFPATALGAASPAQTVTVSNAGGGTLSVTKISAAGDFTETDNCAGAALAAPATCTAHVVFSPAAAGARAGTLTVTASAAAGSGSSSGQQQTATVALTGTGAAPANIVLTPMGLSFGSLLIGATSPARNIAISNTGGLPATLGAAAVTGDFQITANTCGQTLAPQVGCTVAIVFLPTASGARPGIFSVANSVATQTAALSGTGLSPPTDTLMPLTLSFASQTYQTSSAPRTVTLTNSGDAVLTLVSASIASANYSLTTSCGATVPGHSSCTIMVTFTPAAGGMLTGTLVVTDALRTQSISLTGTGVAPPLAGLSPSMLSFAATAVGQSSPSQAATVTNTGGGLLTITSVSTSNGFSDTENCTRTPLAAGASCTVQVVFQPATAGTLTGTLTLAGNMPGGQATAMLSGTGAAPAAIVLTPMTLAFGIVTLGSSASPVQNITISNTGGVSDTLGAASATGDFAITANTCGTTLPAQTGCTAAIGFTPTAAGTRTGIFTITDAAGTHTATLSGIGAASATDGLTPLALSFPAQQVGTISIPQTVTLTNTGDNALTLVSAQITSGDFAALSGCGNTVIGHASCTVAVTYAPKMVGAETGVLTISDQFRSQAVALNGTGIAPPGVSITPMSLSFAALGVGQTSPPQTLTVSNMGGEPLALSGITANGDFTLPAAGNSCAGTVLPAASCTVQVLFAPTVGGSRGGSVSFADNAAGSPQMVALTGIGVDFSLASDGPATATVGSGISAAFALLLSSAAGVPGTVSFACTGAPANALCTVVPASAPLGGTTATIAATVETGVTTAAADLRLKPQLIWLGLLLPLLLAGASPRRGLRNRWRGLAGLALLCCLAFAAGCGSGRIIPPPGGGGGGGGGGVVTPPGTYAITVTGTSAGLSRSVTLSLTVQ